MADIIRIADRRCETRRSASSAEPDTGARAKPKAGAKAKILLFTGIRYERLGAEPAWTRVELPTLPALPAPA